MNVNTNLNKKGILVSGNKSKENKSKKVSWGENKITTYLNNNEIESEQNKLMTSLSKISEENSFSFQNNNNESFNRLSIDNSIINNNNNNSIINQQNKNNVLNNSNILNTNFNNNNNYNNKYNNRITLNNDFLLNNAIEENENINLNNSTIINNKNQEPENNYKNKNNRITINMNPIDFNQFNNENISFDNNNNININNNDDNNNINNKINNNIIINDNNNNIKNKNNETSKIKVSIIKSPNYLLDKSNDDKKIDMNITQNLIDINQEPNLFLSSKNSTKKISDNNKINNLDYSFMNNNKNFELSKSQTNSPKNFQLLKERNNNNRKSITSAKRIQRITQDFNEEIIFNNSIQKTEEKNKNNNEKRFSFNSSIQSIKIKSLPDINNQFIEIYNKTKAKKENLLKNIEELSKEFNELLVKKNELIKLNEIIKKNIFINTIETNKCTENIDKIKHFDKTNEKIKNFFGIKVIFTNNFILNNTNYDKYSFSILLLNQIKLTFIVSKNLINNKNNLINNYLLNNNNNNTQNEKNNEKIEIFEIKSKIIKKSETSNEKLLENNNQNKYYNLIQSTYLNWINKFIPNNSILTIKNLKNRMKNILKFSANYLHLIDTLNVIFIYGNEIILKYDEKNFCFNILFWIFKENGLKIKFIFSIDILNSFKGINFIGLETEDLNTKDHILSEKFINPIYELNIKIKEYLNLKNNEKIPFFENFFTKLYEIVDKI